MYQNTTDFGWSNEIRWFYVDFWRREAIVNPVPEERRLFSQVFIPDIHICVFKTYSMSCGWKLLWCKILAEAKWYDVHRSCRNSPAAQKRFYRNDEEIAMSLLPEWMLAGNQDKLSLVVADVVDDDATRTKWREMAKTSWFRAVIFDLGETTVHRDLRRLRTIEIDIARRATKQNMRRGNIFPTFRVVPNIVLKLRYSPSAMHDPYVRLRRYAGRYRRK